MDEMKLVATIAHDGGVTRVLRPVLDDAERERRFQTFRDAVTRFFDNLQDGDSLHGCESLYDSANQARDHEAVAG